MEARQRRGRMTNVCRGTPYLGPSKSSTDEHDSSIQFDPRIELWA